MRRRATIGLALVILALVPQPPVGASGGSDPATSLLSPLGRQAVAGARDVVADVRSAIDAESYSAAVAALEPSHERLPDGDIAPAHTPIGDPSAVSALPPALRPSVAGLSAAVSGAADLLGGPRRQAAVSGQHRRMIAMAADQQALALAALRRSEDGSQVENGTAATSAGAGLEPRIAAQSVRAARRTIAAALDLYLPALRADAATQVRATSASADGCDLLDQLPYLCVGSEASNTYTDDALLQIDLGGDDIYANSSGGAPFHHPSQDVWIGVSVLVDMAGADRYGATAYAPAISGLAGQDLIVRGAGAAFGNGTLGMLVDEGAGADTYVAEVSDETLESDAGPFARAIVVAQGAGAFGGSGLLLDGGGNDSYTVSGPRWSTTLPDLNLTAQAATQYPTAGTAALLVDRGAGQDAYDVDGVRPDDGQPTEPGTLQRIIAQGAVWSGAVGAFAAPVRKDAAVLVDGGGADHFRVRGFASNNTAPRYPAAAFPTPFVMAQGFGQDGLGMLLSGEGETTYEIQFDGVGGVAPAIWGQGASWSLTLVPNASFTGVSGVLDDQGGDDRYHIDIGIRLDEEIVVSDTSCSSHGAPCSSANVSLSMAACVQDLNACSTYASGGQGGTLNGDGLLEDHAGDDQYLYNDHRTVTVSVRDTLSEPQAPPRVSVEGYLATDDTAQGAAGARGVAALVDHQGTDSYTIAAGTVTRAGATSLHAQGTPRVAVEAAGNVWSAGQGSTRGSPAVGALLDLAGTGDVVHADFSNQVQSTQQPDSAFVGGGKWPLLQGGGSAGGVFAVLGTGPRVSSSPARPTCWLSPTPARGFGTWFDCGPIDQDSPPAGRTTDVAGTGTVPAAVGRATQIQPIDMPTTAAHGVNNDDRIEVAARLQDPSGDVPLPGMPLRFTLQVRRAGLGFWENLGEVVAVSSEDGTARARLPLRYPARWHSFDPASAHRILVSFDGVGGELRPSYSASMLTLS